MSIKDFKLKARLVTFAAGMSVAGMAQSLMNRPSATPAPSKGSGGLDGMPPDLRQRPSADKSMRPRQIVGSLARHAMNGIDVGFHSLAALKYQKPEQLENDAGEKVNAGDTGLGQADKLDKKRLGSNKPKPVEAGAAEKHSLAQALDRSIAEILDSTAASNGLAKKYSRKTLRPAFETAFHGLRVVRNLLGKLAQQDPTPAPEFPKAMATGEWVEDQRSRLADAKLIDPPAADGTSKPQPKPRKSSFDDEKPGSGFGDSESSMSSTVMTPPSSSSGMSVHGSRSSSSLRAAALVEPKGPRKGVDDLVSGQQAAIRRSDALAARPLPYKEEELKYVMSVGTDIAQRFVKAVEDHQDAQERQRSLLALNPPKPAQFGWSRFAARNPDWTARFAKAVEDEKRAEKEMNLATEEQKEHMALMASMSAGNQA